MSGLKREVRSLDRLLAAVAAVAAITAAAVATAAATITAIAATATTAAVTTAAAATAATTTSTITAATTATATEAAGARTLFTRTGNVHREGAAFHLEAMKFLDGLLGLVATAHRHKRETARPTGELVEDDLNDTDGANLAEQGFKILRGAGEGEISHVELVVF